LKQNIAIEIDQMFGSLETINSAEICQGPKIKHSQQNSAPIARL
jgi:hypothetical protein